MLSDDCCPRCSIFYDFMCVCSSVCLCVFITPLPPFFGHFLPSLSPFLSERTHVHIITTWQHTHHRHPAYSNSLSLFSLSLFCLSVCLSVCVSVCLSVCLSLSLFCLSVCLSVSVSLSVCLSLSYAATLQASLSGTFPCGKIISSVQVQTIRDLFVLV